MSLQSKGQEITRPNRFHQLLPSPATKSHSHRDKDKIRNVLGTLHVYELFLKITSTLKWSRQLESHSFRLFFLIGFLFGIFFGFQASLDELVIWLSDQGTLLIKNKCTESFKDWNFMFYLLKRKRSCQLINLNNHKSNSRASESRV